MHVHPVRPRRHAPYSRRHPRVTAAEHRVAFYLYLQDDALFGAPRVLVTLANSFTALGFRVEVVTNRGTASALEALRPEITVIDLSSSTLRGTWRPLVHYLRTAPPDTLITAMEHPNLLALAAKTASRCRSRMIVSCHGDVQARLRFVYKWRDRILLPLLIRWGYPRADAIVCVSQGVAQSLGRFLPPRCPKITTIYNPVVDDDFYTRASAAPAVPLPPQIADASSVVVSAARFAKEKDIGTLLRAVATLRQQRDVTLILLGRGPEEAAIRQQIHLLRLEDAVFMPGFVTNPLPYIRLANVLVLSSIFEGFGLVLVEAMACGTPVVSTDCPSGPREILMDGRYGPLVPPRRPDYLAAAIARVLSSPPSSQILMRRARDFATGTITNEYLNLIRA